MITVRTPRVRKSRTEKCASAGQARYRQPSGPSRGYGDQLNYRTVQQESGGEIGFQEPVSLRVPSRSDYALLARLVVSSVGETAGFGPEDIYDLKLAVTEAVTNVIRHASVEHMQVDYRTLPGVVEVTVSDTGGGFNVAELNREPGEAGGFGLAVIRNLVDEVVLDSADQGTTIKMTRHAVKLSS